MESWYVLSITDKGRAVVNNRTTGDAAANGLSFFALPSGYGVMQLKAQVSKTWGVVSVWLVGSHLPQHRTVASRL